MHNGLKKMGLRLLKHRLLMQLMSNKHFKLWSIVIFILSIVEIFSLVTVKTDDESEIN